MFAFNVKSTAEVFVGEPDRYNSAFRSFWVNNARARWERSAAQLCQRQCSQELDMPSVIVVVVVNVTGLPIFRSSRGIQLLVLTTLLRRSRQQMKRNYNKFTPAKLAERKTTALTNVYRKFEASSFSIGCQTVTTCHTDSATRMSSR